MTGSIFLLTLLGVEFAVEDGFDHSELVEAYRR